jgi:hypothetical protein
MELKVFESPKKEWDEFASQYTDLIFYQSIWSEVLRKGLGGQPLYFYLKEGGEIVAGLPGILLDFKIFKILYASIPYGNLIGKRSYFQPFQLLLEKEFRKRGIDQVRIAESPFSESYPFDKFKSVPARSTLLDLSGFDPTRIWESYRSEVRRAIRKAQKNGLVVKRATSEREVKIFYQLYLSSMERNRAGAKYPPKWFDAVYGILVSQQMADILFAVKGDEHTAGVVAVYSPTVHHYLHNGSNKAYLENRPNDLIVDYLIQNGIKKGKTFLDFMGSDRNDFSLIRFKEKWGSQSLDLHTYIKDYHPLRSKIWEAGKNMAASRWGSKLVRLFGRGLKVKE